MRPVSLSQGERAVRRVRVIWLLASWAVLLDVLAPLAVGYSNGCSSPLWLPFLGLAVVLGLAGVVSALRLRFRGEALPTLPLSLAILALLAVPADFYLIVQGCAIAWWS